MARDLASPPTMNTRILRILINICRQVLPLRVVRFWAMLGSSGFPHATNTVHRRTQFHDFFIFVLLHTFYGIHFYKIGIYDPDLASRTLISIMACG
jgi:hypothetical protein